MMMMMMVVVVVVVLTPFPSLVVSVCGGCGVPLMREKAQVWETSLRDVEHPVQCLCCRRCRRHSRVVH